MLQEYFYAIIALGLILIAIAIYYVVIKNKTKNLDEVESESFEEEIQEIKSKETPKEPQPEQEDEEKDNSFILKGEEEGSFGHIEETHHQDETKQSDDSQKKYRIKGEVPDHGKISKENFKEFAGVKLLVAEDNLINQKVINGLLSDSGIDITMADDGQIALDILEKDSNFNMVLMDAHMPRVDGFEATRAIRANPEYEHIVVVALSGDTAADDIRKMTESGMQEHLEKPLKMDSLYDVLYAYTKSNSNKQDSEYVEVVMTKELNGDKGLSICGGDDNFYKDILKEFKDNYTDSPKQISELLEKNDIQSVDKILLDIIGVSANIGADRIKDIAQDLKEAIKDTEEKSYMTIMDEYKKHLSILIKDIKDYL